MSKFEKLNVDIRKEQGTSAARRTRLRNKVPAVVYHSGVEATPLFVDHICKFLEVLDSWDVEMPISICSAIYHIFCTQSCN